MKAFATLRDPRTRRFRWLRLRREYGRWCYETNGLGDILNTWWEWERP